MDGGYDARLARRRQQQDALGNVRLFPTPGPKLYAGVVWWAFGLWVLFMAQAPFTPSPEDEQRYSELMQQAFFSDAAREAQLDLHSAERNLDKVHVFGWRWRDPYHKLVPPRQAAVDEARARLREAVREREALQSDAKAAVGIWSQYGVDEVRERFWKAYQDGKDFAKRMTWWDVIFGVGGSRDEELYVVLLRWLGQIMMNFTVGLISALISFAISLVYMLWEYKVCMPPARLRSSEPPCPLCGRCVRRRLLDWTRETRRPDTDRVTRCMRRRRAPGLAPRWMQ